MLYTIGYQGTTQEAFIEQLTDQGIALVVDVRDLTRSRLKGFSKNQLREGLQAAGIDHLHLRALGAPAPIRKPYLAGGPYETFRRQYLEHLAQQDDALAVLEAEASRRPSVLLCMERDAERCHRLFVADTMRARGFRITHL